MFRNSIKNNVGYDVLGGNIPMNKVDIIKVPAMIIKGDEDDMVDDKLFQKMIGNYGSDFKKYRVLENTEHASEREPVDLIIARDYCLRFLQKKEKVTFEDL